MDAAQKARLEEQKKLRQSIEQLINTRVAPTAGLDQVVGELARTVDKLTNDVAALNRRINQFDKRA
jgi:phage shock protein A